MIPDVLLMGSGQANKYSSGLAATGSLSKLRVSAANSNICINHFQLLTFHSNHHPFHYKVNPTKYIHVFSAQAEMPRSYRLKVGHFEPEYAGKMNFYLNLLNEQVKLPEENSSIGIILCAEKNMVEVEYALSGMANPIDVAEYKYRKQLPAKLKGELPGASELKKKMQEEISKNRKS